MIDTILLFIGLAGLTAGTFTDFKTREVPDWITFGMVFAGLGIRLLYSLGTFDWWFFLHGLIGFAAFFIVACILYYSGQWGGGDSKMLMGLGALFATYPEILTRWFHPEFFRIPLLAALIINMLLAGAVYGMLWSIFLAFKKQKSFVKEYKAMRQKKNVRTSRNIALALALLILATLFFIQDFALKMMLLVLVFLLVIVVYLWMFIKAVENACMYKLVTPDKLTEGDWIAKEVRVGKKLITGPKDLGISKENIALLIKFHKQHKVGKIIVKEGIPFVPSIFAGLLITLIWGNILFYLI